jgi:hypothetical protein
MTAPQTPPLGEFEIGMSVRYVPGHARGDITHPDCEDGVVTFINRAAVFVRFGRELHAKACYPRDLVRLK